MHLLENIASFTRKRMMRSSHSTAAASTMKKLTRPRLPVPGLRSTLDKYLKSIQPFLLEDEAKTGVSYDAAHDQRVKWAQEFEHGIGKTLQSRLDDLNRASPHNWLEDNFWTNCAWLDGRSPLPVNSNWWLALFNDDTVPLDARQHGPNWITPWQVRRAAWMTHRVLEFKERLLSQELHPNTTRTGLWVRDSTSNMFNIARVPRTNRDTISTPPPPSNPTSRNVLVMLHNQLYAINAYPNSEDVHLPPAHLERALIDVVNDAQARLDRDEETAPVGILTADNRDVWAKNLEHLLSLSSTNHRIHDIINNSIFLLCLDPFTHDASSNQATSSPISVDTPNEINSHLHNIRSGGINGQNRWFDKAFTLILESNTRAGAQGEHAPCDALVPSIVTEYACVESIDSSAFPEDIQTSLEGRVGPRSDGLASLPWERLDWVVDDHIRKECIEAEMRATELLADSDDAVLWFDEYGTQWIQSVTRLSIDAYVQMALQLAFYRIRGEFSATYETALTRSFDRGRTETIRSYTTESRAFVLGMQDPSVAATTKFNLLSQAVRAHTSLTRLAATGKGIDRHLLGLRLLLRSEELEDTSGMLLKDELFARSQEWKLCTSGLSAGSYFRGTGFGAMYPDGYGINYMSGPDLIKFGVESKKSSPATSTAELHQEIAQALRDMQSVCLQGMPAAQSHM